MENKNKVMSERKYRHVLISTRHKAVFYCRLPMDGPSDTEIVENPDKAITLYRARMIINWAHGRVYPELSRSIDGVTISREFEVVDSGVRTISPLSDSLSIEIDGTE